MIKSEVVLQLLSPPAMVCCRVVDNRKTLSTAGALASKRSGVSETARKDSPKQFAFQCKALGFASIRFEWSSY